MNRVRSFKDLVDPVANRRPGSSLLTGLIVLGVGIVIVVLVFLNAVPILDSESGPVVTAQFSSANNVDNRTLVRVNGVDVGQVDSVGPGSTDPLHSSDVKMRISKSGVVLHSDATAEIRWRTVLGGNMYIDINPGSSDAPKLSGPITLKNTSVQTELDDVLRIYNGNTDENQRVMINGLSKTFSNAAGTDKSIDALTNLTTVGNGLAPYQGVDQGDLSKLVATTGQTAEALGANPPALTGLVDGAAQTLSAFDNRRAALADTLELSPGTLDSVQVTSKRLDVTLDKLNPLSDNLNPSAKLIKSTSDATMPAMAKLKTVLSDAQPVLNSARPTFANLKTASTNGVPLIDQLQAPLNELNDNIFPWLQQTSSDTKLKNYESIGPFFSILDNAAAEYDSSGYRLHLTTLLGTASVIDESALTSGLSALQTECKSVAKANQVKNCSAVTNVLGGMLYGGAKK